MAQQPAFVDISVLHAAYSHGAWDNGWGTRSFELLKSRLEDGGGMITLRPSMDRQTLDSYDRTAAETAAKYRAIDSSAWRQKFQEAFPAGGRVLDIASGSGRDLALLLSLGFDAYGTEPSVGMRDAASAEFPQLVGRVFPFGLPLPDDADIGGLYDGLVCSAVLMHVPEAELFDAPVGSRTPNLLIR